MAVCRVSGPTISGVLDITGESPEGKILCECDEIFVGTFFLDLSEAYESW